MAEYALITNGTSYYLAPGAGVTRERAKAHRYGVQEAEDLLSQGSGKRLGFRVEVVREGGEVDELSVLRRRLEALNVSKD